MSSHRITRVLRWVCLDGCVLRSVCLDGKSSGKSSGKSYATHVRLARLA